MTKHFFDVFPTLKVNPDVENLLAGTEITKVSANRTRDSLRIYLFSERLIPKKYIFQTENDIKKQLFKDKEVSVKIIEKFQLSAQYTPKKLLDIYTDSISLELKNYSLLLYNLFRCASLEFQQEDRLILHVEESVVAEERSEDLIRILEKIVCDRCGLKLIVDMVYESKKENNHKIDDDQKIQMEINRIVSMSSFSVKEEDEILSGDETAAKAVTDEKDGKAPQQKTETKPVQKPGGFQEKGKFYGKGGFQKKKSDNPDVIYGRDFEEESMEIQHIQGEIGDVVIRGRIINLDEREIRGEKTIVFITLTDYTDSIVVKIFLKNEQLDEFKENIQKGKFIKMKGIASVDRFDNELTIASIVGIKKIADFTEKRMDTNPRKRVELHCHTKMSDMDGVSDVADIIKQAVAFGHTSLAVTDHGAVQAFPPANHGIPDGADMKIIYGVEAYLVDDLKNIVQHSKGQSLKTDYVVFDLETTGFSPQVNKIIEIGAVKVQNGVITDRFSSFVNPQMPIPFKIEELTGIRDDIF